MFKDLLYLFINPISITKKYSDKQSLKFSFILSAIIAGVMAITSTISRFFSMAIISDYSVKVHKYVKLFKISEVKIGGLFSTFFSTLAITFAVILAVAGILYIITKILKNDNNYFKLVTIVAIATIPVAVTTVLSLLISWLYAPIGIFLGIAGSIYCMFITIYSFRNTLTIENEDILTLCNVVAIVIVSIVLYYILASALSSLTGLGTLMKFLN